MNTLEMSKAIGREGLLATREGLSVSVRIVDARQSFNRIDYLVRPITGGTREAWVSSERISLDEVQS